MDQTSPDEGAFNLSRERVGLSEIGSPTSQERDSEGSFDRVCLECLVVVVVAGQQHQRPDRHVHAQVRHKQLVFISC